MSFSAHTKVLTVDGLTYIKDLTTDDRVFTPEGPSRVTYCGYYDYEGAAVNIDQGVVVVGSHLMQSWLNGWLYCRPADEDERMRDLGLPSFGRPMIRDDLISCVSHYPFIELPEDVAPKQAWVFGTANGLAMVGPYIARTSPTLPEGGFIRTSGEIVGSKFNHWEQDYCAIGWEYKDHSDIQAVISFYTLCSRKVPYSRGGVLKGASALA